MQTRTFGKTGVQVSRLGVGLSEIGYRLTIAQVQQAADVLNTALDGRINFLDTSACYDISEELIGKTVSQRRDDFFLATKAGHIIGGYQGTAWSYQTITDSIERSLRRMKTDHLDLVQLHSCGIDVLEKGDAIRALQDAQQAGKTRFIGYSGDNEDALWAVESGHFDTLQTSYNLADQRARAEILPKAKAANMGVIAKRPIANAAWRAESSPSSYANEYFRRAQKMLAAGPVPGEPDNRILTALGFAWAEDNIDVFIVGTRNPDNMRKNLAWVESELPIEATAVTTLQTRFTQLDDNWVQLT